MNVNRTKLNHMFNIAVLLYIGRGRTIYGVNTETNVWGNTPRYEDCMYLTFIVETSRKKVCSIHRGFLG